MPGPFFGEILVIYTTIIPLDYTTLAVSVSIFLTQTTGKDATFVDARNARYGTALYSSLDCRI